ncbi:hypothetical protein KHC33_15280 [Methanospirillum sp. J.3.6.1-F.2.7.3]|uniref:Uncharacterized protein n=1 Tax=Methanospirillum purgamenti TaxID=2834276 RepID=A0A8E7EH70_9EURY|nr:MULTISPECIES: hypothetical protein [Methanospirillum]MDX8548975.1 hypothetical protein [Methanospirillum hungatei]QVV88662.1 hypothetical protein KHC33_15280 [Methanospirillum sp. J.3.6.1-F.2.7.3]
MRLFWIHLLLHPVYPGPQAKQDVSVFANLLRTPAFNQGFTNDNTNSQFYLSSKNPERAEEFWTNHPVYHMAKHSN